MFIKILKPDFKVLNKNVRFGYSDEIYTDIFRNSIFDFHFYSTKEINKYLICIDEVKRCDNIGSIMSMNFNKIGNIELLKRALEYDYSLKENEYEIINNPFQNK